MSVSLTIANLDDETFRRLQAEALRRGADLETVAGSLLAESLPPEEKTGSATNCKVRDLSALSGTWSKEEYEQFMATVSDYDRIDPEMWQ